MRALRHMEQEARRQAALLDSAIMVVAGLALTLVLYLPTRGATEPLALLTLIAYPMLMLVAVATMAESGPAACMAIRSPWSIRYPGRPRPPPGRMFPFGGADLVSIVLRPSAMALAHSGRTVIAFIELTANSPVRRRPTPPG